MGVLAVTDRELLNYAEDFTARYRSAEDVYAREAACLDLQLAHYLAPLHRGDLVAGRRCRLAIGVLPQEHGGVGYYIDEERFAAMANNPALDEGERLQAVGLLTYWKEESTRAKLIREYPPEWYGHFVHLCWYATPAKAFALYRISGLQMDPGRLLDNGIGGLVALCGEQGDKNPAFFAGVRGALTALGDACLRYADQAQRLRDTDLATDLRHIAWERPATFRQALQLSYLFYVASGAWNFGRMDKYLGPYLHRDLAAGTLTEEAALALIEDLWRRMEEWNEYFDSRVILGGADRPRGADTFARLAMEATRRRRGVVPQLTLRCYEGMDSALYHQALDLIGEGTTFPMLYNDAVNIPAVMDAFGVSRETAQDYVPFGCGEYVLYNKSIGTPSGTINTQHLLNEMMYGEMAEAFATAADFETFYARYLTEVEKIAACMAKHEKLEYDVVGRECPFLLCSAVFDDCLQRGEAVLRGGLHHLGGTIENYGNVNTADSFTAIKEVVYDRRLVTREELAQALRTDFADREALRQLLLAAPKYGNDHPVADEMMTRLHRDVCTIIKNQAPLAGLDSYLAVIINNELNAVFGQATGASADGRHSGQYLANGNNPMSGLDKSGVTALLNSLVKPDTHIHAGAVQNMRFSKEMFTTLRPQLERLLRTYFEQGGAQSMITVLSRGDLEAAMQEPEKYQNLVVRVGGFSARFVTLSPVVQREILARTLY